MTEPRRGMGRFKNDGTVMEERRGRTASIDARRPRTNGFLWVCHHHERMRFAPGAPIARLHHGHYVRELQVSSQLMFFDGVHTDDRHQAICQLVVVDVGTFQQRRLVLKHQLAHQWHAVHGCSFRDGEPLLVC